MVSERAFRLFGKYYAKRRQKYESLRNDLLRANMYVPLEEWLSLALFSSLLIPIVSILLFLLVKMILILKVDWIGLLRHLSDLRKVNLRNVDVNSLWSNIPEYAEVIKNYSLAAYKTVMMNFTLTRWEIIIIVLIAVVTPFLTYNIFLKLPKLRAWERRRKIDGILPHAIGYISSMAAVGVIPYEIFKRLSTVEDMYGEVSIEARKIVRDVELLGYDFLSALRNLTVTTPSDSLRAFIQGAVTTTLSGGEMGDYFVNKTRDYLQQNRKKFEDFLTTLGMITEVYVVGLVAAPLFIIVLYTAMLMLKGASPAVLFFIVYGVIPLGSILFIVLVDAITPEGSK